MPFDIGSFEEITEDRIRSACQLIRPEIPVSPVLRIEDGPWAKCECDNPTGAFKVRGGLVYFEWLKSHHPEVTTAIAATRGNHGQSVGFAAERAGLRCRIVVPFGNSPAKNDAMRLLGADLVEHGRDFAEALEFARTEAEETGAHFVPSFDWKLVLGVSTYAYEFFEEAPKLDAVYVPIGLGSGICGTIAASHALSPDTRIIGVVAERAPAYARSFAAGHVVEETRIPDTIADGVACRIPVQDSFEIIRGNVADVVTVPEPEIEAAIAELHEITSRRIEGAGAIAYAAWKRNADRSTNAGVILSGGNLDDEVFDSVIGRFQA